MHQNWKAAALAAFLLSPVIARAQDANLIRHGKEATALVVIKQGSDRIWGSAFCISSDGFFVTNAHVIPTTRTGLQRTLVRSVVPVRVPGRGIVMMQRERIVTRAVTTVMELVVNPGESDQKAYLAHLIKIDRSGDLAVLAIVPNDSLPVLELGQVGGLIETSPVIAFGYPFGQLLADQQDFPNVTVSTGRITSLRKSHGELTAIQLDASLNPGNSGGPVVDEKGHVVGIVEKGIPGASINFAIPVTRLMEFLNEPMALLVTPKLDPQTATTPGTFTIRMLAMQPQVLQDAKVELEFSTDSGPTRKFPARKLKANIYEVTAAPLPQDQEASPPASEPQTRPAEEQAATPSPQVVRYAIIVKKEGQPDARSEGHLTIGTPAPASPTTHPSVAAAPANGAAARATSASAAPSEPAAAPTTFAVQRDDNKKELELPSPVEQICGSGAGRFLVLWMPLAKQVGIVDVKAGRLDNVPVGSDHPLVTATAQKLFIVLPERGILQRWDIQTRHKEIEQPLTQQQNLLAIAAGEAATGPLLIVRRGHIELLDPTSLAPLKTTIDREDLWRQWTANGRCRACASADGQTFAVWETVQPQPTFLLTVDGSIGHWKTQSGTPVAVRPGFDGRLIFADGVFDSALSPIQIPAPPPMTAAPTVMNYGPTHSPAYFVRIERKMNSSPLRIQLLASTDHSVLATLPQMEELSVGGIRIDPSFQTHLALPDRIHVIPSLNQVVNVDPEGKYLVIRRLDVDHLMAESGNDFLFVQSVAPRLARAGKTYEYHLSVASKQGGTTCSLESGPPGMSVSSDGAVKWNVPAALTGQPESVVILIKDKSGREVYHTFKIWVE